MIPTLDLRDGTCVAGPTAADGQNGAALGNVFGVAQAWATAGFQRLHVGDLDAADGDGSNEQLMDELVKQSECDIQVAGGIESAEQIQRFVDAGVLRVILGPRAISEPDWLANVAEMFPGVVVVATDVRERRVVTRGWIRSLPFDILDVVEDLSGLPLGGLLVSSAEQGLRRSISDLALLEDVAEMCEFPVMARGGVVAMEDIRALEHRGVSAVLLGEPLYSGLLDSRAVAQEFG